MSFFNSKSESSEGVVFKGNLEASVLQFGDLLDTEVRWSPKIMSPKIMIVITKIGLLSWRFSFK